jgi:hypothetical protein
VRIEQFFRAYDHALPPRRQPQERVRVILYGSMEQYRSYLYAQQLDIDHPAFYSATSNTIVAGADLPYYAERLQQVRAENDRLREQYAALDKAFPKRQTAMAEQLQKAGFSDDQIRDEMRARTNAWKGELEAMLRKLDEVDRRNQERFEQVSTQLYARLRHEAFHAYVENYLFPQRDYAFPRWLNEGLAQVFETAVLDGETLRIDAPDRELLRRLQADLGGEPLPLADLLGAVDAAFLNTHARAGATQRRYLYSWGLAWHLLFRRDLARGEALEKYVALEAASLSPIERFEQLVGMKLPDFEPHWREAMFNPTPAPR